MCFRKKKKHLEHREKKHRLTQMDEVALFCFAWNLLFSPRITESGAGPRQHTPTPWHTARSGYTGHRALTGQSSQVRIFARVSSLSLSLITLELSNSKERNQKREKKQTNSNSKLSAIHCSGQRKKRTTHTKTIKNKEERERKKNEPSTFASVSSFRYFIALAHHCWLLFGT